VTRVFPPLLCATAANPRRCRLRGCYNVLLEFPLSTGAVIGFVILLLFAWKVPTVRFEIL